MSLPASVDQATAKGGDFPLNSTQSSRTITNGLIKCIKLFSYNFFRVQIVLLCVLFALSASRDRIQGFQTRFVAFILCVFLLWFVRLLFQPLRNGIMCMYAVNAMFRFLHSLVSCRAACVAPSWAFVIAFASCSPLHMHATTSFCGSRLQVGAARGLRQSASTYASLRLREGAGVPRLGAVPSIHDS